MYRSNRRFLVTIALASATTILAGAPQVHAEAGSVLEQFDAPGCSPQGLGWDGTTLWVANLESAPDRCTRDGAINESRGIQVDPTDGTVLGGFAMPGIDQGLASDQHHHGFAFDSDGNIWTNAKYYGDIVVYYPDRTCTHTMDCNVAGGEVCLSNMCRKRYQLPSHRSQGVARNNETNEVFVLDNTTGILHIYQLTDEDELELARSVKLQGDPVPTSYLGFAWDGSHLWAVGANGGNTDTDYIHRFDLTDGTQIAQFTFPLATEQAVGLTYDGKCLWVSTATSGSDLDLLVRLDHGESDLPECAQVTTTVDAGTTDVDAEAGPDATDDGGCCDSSRARPTWPLWGLVGVLLLRRRRDQRSPRIRSN